jgi:hypothetical protein
MAVAALGMGHAVLCDKPLFDVALFTTDCGMLSRQWVAGALVTLQCKCGGPEPIFRVAGGTFPAIGSAAELSFMRIAGGMAVQTLAVINGLRECSALVTIGAGHFGVLSHQRKLRP